MRKINKVIRNIFKPRNIIAKESYEIDITWCLLLVGYLTEDKSHKDSRIRGYWVFSLLGIAVTVTDYNKDWKHSFHNIDITNDLEYLDFDNNLVYIDDWQVNIDMKRTILSVSGYINTVGNAVITGIYYKRNIVS